MNQVLKYRLDKTVDLSLPLAIKEFCSEYDTPIMVYDYDYVRSLVANDFLTLGSYLKTELSIHNLKFYLVSYSFYMPNSLLAKRRKYDFEYAKYNLSEWPDIIIPIIEDQFIVKIGYTSINTIENWIDCARYLFSGNYEKRSILLGLDEEIDFLSTSDVLKSSIVILYNRHKEVKDVELSIKSLWETMRNDSCIIYPYGGADLGACLLFELRGNLST